VPLIDISIAEGRSPEQLRALIDGVHRVAEETVDAAPENVTVIVREVPHAHWARGNRTIAERAAGADPADGPAGAAGGAR
jgi:4-oxalocrotonate tautomerase